MEPETQVKLSVLGAVLGAIVGWALPRLVDWYDHRQYRSKGVSVHPCPDVPGQWIAHDFERDIVTQGNSKEHALEMLEEAVHMVDEDGRATKARRMSFIKGDR